MKKERCQVNFLREERKTKEKQSRLQLLLKERRKQVQTLHLPLNMSRNMGVVLAKNV